MKKAVFFDTNSRYCDIDAEIYRIHELEIRHRKLTEGDHVTAYMDNEEWDARIVRHGDQWGLVLLSEAREISKERYEGHAEGFRGGAVLEKLRTLRVLENLDLPEDILKEAKRRLELL